jgi:hypothetical protein
MKKSQAPGVQQLPITVARCLPIHFIADDRMTDRVEVNSNLVSSSREDLAKDQSPMTRFLDDCKLGLSRTPTLDHSHFLTVHRMTADGLHNFTDRGNEFAGAQRQIEFLNLAPGKLAAQSQMGQVMLGNHQATAGFFIEPMHHPRTKFAADAAQVSDMMKKRINQRSRLNACSRMNHHPSRFVDDQQIFILEKNAQPYIFGLEIDRFRFRFRDRYMVPCADDLLGSAGSPVQEDSARMDQHLNPSAREALDFPGQEKVETLFGIRRSNDDLLDIPIVH